MKRFLVLVSILVFCFQFLIAQKLPAYIPYRKGIHWGYSDSTKRIRIQPIFEEVGIFSEGLAAVRVNKKWGIIDTSGKIVINPGDFEVFAGFKNGYAWIRTFRKGAYTYIDRHGRMISKPIFCDFGYDDSNFSLDGYAIVTKNCKDCSPESDNMCADFGVIDKNGTIVVKLIYKRIHRSPYKGFYLVAVAKGDGLKWGLLDIHSGKIVVPCRYNLTFSDLNDSSSIAFHVKAILKNTTISMDLSNRFSHARFDLFFNDTITRIVTVTYKKGVIDGKGHMIVPIKYRDIYLPFVHGKAVTVDTLHRWGIISDHDSTVLPFDYSYLWPFGNNYVASKGRQSGLIDGHGKEIIPFVYDVLYPGSQNILIATKERSCGMNGKYALLDKNGQIIYPFSDFMLYPAGQGLYSRQELKTVSSQQVWEIHDYIDLHGTHYWED
jgi:hypothetical protein